jgi:hypothetical protein
MKEYFASLHGAFKGSNTAYVMENFPFSWTILCPGYYDILQAGEIHSVLSLNASAVIGWQFTLPEWITDGTLKETVARELKILGKRSSRSGAEGDDDYENPSGILQELKASIDYVRSYTSLNDEKRQILNSLITRWDKKLVDIEKELEE